VNDLPTNPQPAEELARAVALIADLLDTALRFPDWPFRAETGCAAIAEFGVFLSGYFDPVIDALARYYGDTAITFLAVEPGASYYIDRYGISPAISVDASALPDGYGKALYRRPGEDPFGEMNLSANVFGITGTSRRWAAWAQRDWEIGVLLTPDRTGPWREVGISFLDDTERMEDFRGPHGWVMPLTLKQRAVFDENFRTRGSGS